MHTQFLQQAVELACTNVESGAGGPYGALIVKDGVIVAACANRVTTHLDPTAHAEIVAIREACKNLGNFQLTGCSLYTSCEPCPMCLGAIYWARLDRVYYACSRHDAAAAGFDDSFIYDEIALPPQHRKIEGLHLNIEDACRPFTLWNGKSEKIPY
ncbi:MAG: nucleoside deaminase [Gammaproteobacteria bacterium]